MKKFKMLNLMMAVLMAIGQVPAQASDALAPEASSETPTVESPRTTEEAPKVQADMMAMTFSMEEDSPIKVAADNKEPAPAPDGVTPTRVTSRKVTSSPGSLENPIQATQGLNSEQINSLKPGDILTININGEEEMVQVELLILDQNGGRTGTIVVSGGTLDGPTGQFTPAGGNNIPNVNMLDPDKLIVTDGFGIQSNPSPQPPVKPAVAVDDFMVGYVTTEGGLINPGPLKPAPLDPNLPIVTDGFGIQSNPSPKPPVKPKVDDSEYVTTDYGFQPLYPDIVPAGVDKPAAPDAGGMLKPVDEESPVPAGSPKPAGEDDLIVLGEPGGLIDIFNFEEGDAATGTTVEEGMVDAGQVLFLRADDEKKKYEDAAKKIAEALKDGDLNDDALEAIIKILVEKVLPGLVKSNEAFKKKIEELKPNQGFDQELRLNVSVEMLKGLKLGKEIEDLVAEAIKKGSKMNIKLTITIRISKDAAGEMTVNITADGLEKSKVEAVPTRKVD